MNVPLPRMFDRLHRKMEDGKRSLQMISDSAGKTREYTRTQNGVRAGSWEDNQDGGRIWLIVVVHGLAFVSRVLSMLARSRTDTCQFAAKPVPFHTKIRTSRMLASACKKYLFTLLIAVMIHSAITENIGKLWNFLRLTDVEFQLN